MSFHTLVYHEVRDHENFTDVQNFELISQSGYHIRLPSKLYVTVQQFQEQMDFLISENFHFLTMNEIRNFYNGKTELANKSILITFDDAYQSTYYNAYPILKKAGIKALLFIVSGWVFEDSSEMDINYSKVMSWEQVQLIQDVFELANHTHDLHHLIDTRTNSLMKANFNKLKNDLLACNQRIEHVDTFAYPFGFYDDSTVNNLVQAGINFAFTTQCNINTKSTQPMALHRLLVHNELSLADFKEYIMATSSIE